MSRSIPLATLAAVGALTVAAAGCGSSSQRASAARQTTATTAAATEAATGSPASAAYGAVPAGTVLNVGDQDQDIETLLRVSGIGAELPFKINYVEFASGPLLDAGFAAGRIDVASILGDLPAALTQSSDLPVRAIAFQKPTGNTPQIAVVAKPGINSISQLKGKPFAYTTGTEEQSIALSALGSVGLKQSDVQQVNVALQQLYTVLEAGEADASVLGENQVLIYQQDHPGAKVLYSNLDANPAAYLYQLATTAALANPAKLAAIKDLVKASIEANNWVQHNQAAWAADYYEGVEHETAAQAKLGVLELQGEDIPYTPAVQQAEQEVANLQAQSGAIKQGFSVAPMYTDTSWLSWYNQLLQEVHQDG